MSDNSQWTTKDAWQTEDEWDTEERFDLEGVRKGVAKGNRHHAFHQYLGWLVKEKYSKSDAMAELIAWNKLNHPPIPENELKYEIEFYWAMWMDLSE